MTPPTLNASCPLGGSPRSARMFLMPAALAAFSASISDACGMLVHCGAHNET